MNDAIIHTATAHFPGRSRAATFCQGSALLGVAAAALLASAGGARAADADAGAPLADSPSDPILVTARRRAENVQDVPISITVLGGDRLESANLQTLDQIKQIAPSLQLFAINPRNTNINIRNLGSNASASGDGLDPGVGVYIDDVYYARPGQSVFDLVDVERVEVLKGPQGTLFGRNTTAGALNIATRAPSFEPEGTGELSIGDYGYVQARAAASVPMIADRLAVRLTGAVTRRDGVIHNVLTGRDVHNIDSQLLRGQVLFKPSDDFSIRIIGDYSRRKEECCISLVAGTLTSYPNGTAIASNVVQRFDRIGYTPPSVNPYDRVTDVDAPLRYTVKQSGVSANAQWAGDNVSVTSITAYRTWDWAPSNDFDSLALSIQKRFQSTQHQRQFSQELRLASEGERSIDYVAGLYYFTQSLPQSQVTEYGPDAAAYQLPLAIPATIGTIALDGFTTNGRSTAKTWSYAAFGQANWHIDPRLTLTLGLRYTYERKQGSYLATQVAGLPTAGLTAAEVAQVATIRNTYGRAYTLPLTKVDKGSVSGLANLSFRASDAVLVYATYARGAKSGGLNIAAVPAGVSPVVGPEKVNHYELGLKTSPLPGVTLNGALFWTEIGGFQATLSQTEPVSLSYLTNAAKVRSRGGEVDLTVRPLRGVSLYGSAVYADAVYASYANAPCAPGLIPPDPGRPTVCNLSDQDLPNTPKWTLSAGGELSHSLGRLDVYGGSDWSYRTSINSAANNSPFGVVPGYLLVQARAGIRAADGSWDIYAWAKNLFDKNYLINYSIATNGLATARVGDPRTIGVTGRFRL